MIASMEFSDCNDDQQEMAQLHDENFRLQQKNEILLNELGNLKKQFSEISTINQNLQNSHEENNQLSVNYRKLQDEKDDLQRRFDICMAQLNECKQNLKFQNHGKNNENVTANILSMIEKKKTISNTPKDAETQQQINELKDQIKELLKSKRKLEAELHKETNLQRISKEQNEKLLRSIAQYFDLQYYSDEQIVLNNGSARPIIRNADDFISYLKTHQTEDYLKKSISQQYKKEIEEQKQNFLVIIKKLKSKLKQEKNAKDQLEAAYKASEIEYQNTIEKLKKESEKVQVQNTDFEYQNMGNTTSISHLIPSFGSNHELSLKDQKLIRMKNKINELRQEVQHLTSQLHECQSKPAAQEAHSICYNCEQLQSQLFELKSENEKLTNSNKELTKQNSLIKAKNEQIQSNKQNYSLEITQLKLDKDEFEGKYNFVVSQYELLKTEVKTLQTRNDEREMALSRSNNALMQLQKMCSAHKEDISTLYDQRNRLTELIYKLRETIQKDFVYIENLLNENSSLKERLKQIQNEKIAQNTPLKAVSEKVPVTSWFCQDFDSELCNKISEFAVNDAYPFTAKLKHVFLTIARHYNNKCQEFQRSIESINETHSKTLKSISEFIILFTKPFNSTEIDSIESLFNPLKVANFLNVIKMHLNHEKQLETDLSIAQSQIISLQNQFDVPSIDLIEKKFYDLQKSINAKDNEIDSLLKKLRQTKKQFKTEISTHTQGKQDNKQIIEQKNKIINDLTQKNQDLSTSLARLEATTTATIDASVYEESEKRSRNKIVSQKQKIISLQNSIKEMTARVQNDTRKNQEQCKQYEAAIQKLQNDVSFWKDSSDVLKNVQNVKELEIQKLKFDYEKFEDEMKQQHVKELDQLREQYETIVSTLKCRNHELTKTTEKLSLEFNKKSDSLKQMKEQIYELENEKQDLESRLSSQIEKEKRDVTLNEQKMKAYKMSLENQYMNQFDQLKEKCEDEKKSLYQYAANSFNLFFDMNSKLNEDSYKETIQKSSNELEKLIKQDIAIRRILGITKNESPELAISQLLIALYRQS